MSDDIVNRLRAAGHNALMDEAADEIERLTAERDKWKLQAHYETDTAQAAIDDEFRSGRVDCPEHPANATATHTLPIADLWVASPNGSTVKSLEIKGFSGERGGTRTHDLVIKSRGWRFGRR